MAIRATPLARIAGLAMAALVLSTSAAGAAAPLPADTAPPTGAVGGFQSPVRGTLALTVDAIDEDSGLTSASALIDGAVAATTVLGTGCPADPPTGVVDLTVAGCVPRISGAPLPIDLSAAAVGTHHLQVRVTDAAGNTAIFFDGDLAVAGVDPVYTARVEVAVGNPGATTGATTGGATLAGTGTLPTSSSAATCVRPELSMWLDQKPVRIQRGKPVLKAGARYRYRGRLTCLVGNRRVGAPRGTPIDLLFRLHGRTRAVTGATTMARGRLSVILAYRTSLTLLFRYRSTAATTTVYLPILVTRKARR